MHLVPYSCQNLSQNHCLIYLESVPTEHIPLLKPRFFDGIPPPCFLHLFNLFSVHFEPFPWKTGHNTISFYLNCYSGHVWNVRYSCVIHGHYWRSVWKSALLGTPETAAESWLLIHCIVSFPEQEACSALWGEKVSCNCQEQSCFWKRSCGRFICHLMHVFQPGWWSPQPALTHGFENLFRPRLWPGPFRSHGRVVAIQKNLPSFCLAGHGKAIVENVPDVGTPMNSKRDRHGCEGKTSVTLVPCFPFLSLSSLVKAPFMLQGPLVLEKAIHAMGWRSWPYCLS